MSGITPRTRDDLDWSNPAILTVEVNLAGERVVGNALPRTCKDCGTAITRSSMSGRCGTCAKQGFASRYGGLIAPLSDVERIWCNQCDRRVSKAAGAACVAPFCKGKGE